VSTLVIRIPRDPARPIQFVNDARLAGLLKHGPAQVHRGSYILPISRPKRWAFRLFRRLFGETGRVAAWTRSWRGPWRVDLGPSAGPVIQPFTNRQDAIDAEIVWLNQHLSEGPRHA
jgi:hypothetical protein